MTHTFPRRVALTVALSSLAPASGRAQSSEVSELWREWAVLSAEWRAERAVYDRDRQRNQELRAASEGGAQP
jgi:hypothetical protein